MIAGLERVDVAEGREIGGAMPRDRRRPGDARGSAFPGRRPGPLFRSFGVGALDDHEVRADVRDDDPPDRAAVARVVFELGREERDPPRSSGREASVAPFEQRRRRAFQFAQRRRSDGPGGISRSARRSAPATRALCRASRSARPPSGDQGDRQQVQRAAGASRAGAAPVVRPCPPCSEAEPQTQATYRRRADSVPPSEPGPA